MNANQLFITRLKLLGQTFKNIYKIGKINLDNPDEVADDIIENLLYSIQRETDRLTLRAKVARSIGGFSHSEYKDQIATLVNDEELLEAFIKILNYFPHEDKEPAIEMLRHIEYNEEEFFDNKSKEVLRYFNLKGRCVHQDVIAFLDENLWEICKEELCLKAINDIIANFTQEGLEIKIFIGARSIDENHGIINPHDFDGKTKANMISLINAVIISYREEVPLMTTETYTLETAAQVMRKTIKPVALELEE